MESELTNLFEMRKEDDRTNLPDSHVSYRVKSNIYKIRAFELYGSETDFFFRIYHADDINENLKQALVDEVGVISLRYTIDYKSKDYNTIASNIKNVLLNQNLIDECKLNSRSARTSRFQGLDLPDIDTSQSEVLGQTFSWREIISIWEDNSDNNDLKKSLSKKGIYIQRSKDGKSRYIGSAYGADGIIGRWMKHLDSNGNAQHLNLFVLEIGYNEMVFSVIEFYDGEDIIKRENLWKQILGTTNFGPYNGIQLNNN